MGAAEQVVGFRGGGGSDLLFEHLDRLVNPAGGEEILGIVGGCGERECEREECDKGTDRESDHQTGFAGREEIPTSRKGREKWGTQCLPGMTTVFLNATNGPHELLNHPDMGAVHQGLGVSRG
jgi:hypothetical protein